MHAIIQYHCRHNYFLKGTKLILFLFLLIRLSSSAQNYPAFSMATGLDLQRSFKKEQRFWTVGHTSIANFHITARDGIYVWFCYFVEGKFSNQLTATAKLPSTIPQQISYENDARLRFKHLSIGWKKYLKGSPVAEKGWNLYGNAGLGLMLGRVTNVHSVNIDTAAYSLPVLSGRANFKRLTLDLGLGAEVPIGSDLYFYGEAKALIPTTDYPSRYIFVNEKAPLTASLAAGLRLQF